MDQFSMPSLTSAFSYHPAYYVFLPTFFWRGLEILYFIELLAKLNGHMERSGQNKHTGIYKNFSVRFSAF